MKLFPSSPETFHSSKRETLAKASFYCLFQESRHLPVLGAPSQSLEKSAKIKAGIQGDKIAKSYSSKVEGNHGEHNLEFHRGKKVYQRKPNSASIQPTCPPTSPPLISSSFRRGQIRVEHAGLAGFQMKDLDSLCDELKSFLATKGLLKENPSGELAIPGTFMMEDNLSENLDRLVLENLNSEELLQISTASKSSSVRVQCFISECTQKELEIMMEKLKPFFESLIVDQFGSFVLQRLLANFAPSIPLIETLCYQEFKNLSSNQYSSRVMQLLIEKSKEFCEFSLSYFRANFEQAISMSSACHLLVAALKNVKLAQSRDFVLDRLRQKPGLIGNRFFHRVLLTYVYLGTQEQLDDVASELRVGFRLAKLFNRRATNTIVLTLIKRGHQETINALCWQLAKNPVSLLDTRYFTTSLHQASQDCSQVLAPVFKTLLGLESRAIDCLSNSGENKAQISYLLLTCCSKTQFAEAANFLKRHNLLPQPLRLEKCML